MSIINFPKHPDVPIRRFNQKKKVRLVETGQKVHINHNYVKDVFKKHGYKRSEDPCIKELIELLFLH
ncbi:hypothetical protein [Neobacillus sp. YIM B06451]|uniref:hypothetical protein n=1 Tax=Neobacillus sp. YIM B06451 TaxID=3070994 RepID=UPI00292E6363|nr:hypothetical protein [Neobacillus sp. YIM B06451]